ncbi:MAG: hypothetical protein K0U38_10975 [Epsilonproteobacteria bacterium]|nr:hypothetical protein [Campylobacterota bacterium]
MKKIVFLMFFVLNVFASESYSDCILENMKGVKSDIAAKAIKEACRSKFQSQWEYLRTVKFTSPRTKNNDDHLYQSKYCDHASSDGKWCADEVSIVGHVKKDDEKYEYRFQDIKGSCPIKISSGPKGWMKIISCSLNSDGKIFKARVMGWTKPQTFTATLKIERREK